MYNLLDPAYNFIILMFVLGQECLRYFKHKSDADKGSATGNLSLLVNFCKFMKVLFESRANHCSHVKKFQYLCYIKDD